MNQVQMLPMNNNPFLTHSLSLKEEREKEDKNRKSWRGGVVPLSSGFITMKTLIRREGKIERKWKRKKKEERKRRRRRKWFVLKICSNCSNIFLQFRMGKNCEEWRRVRREREREREKWVCSPMDGPKEESRYIDSGQHLVTSHPSSSFLLTFFSLLSFTLFSLSFCVEWWNGGSGERTVRVNHFNNTKGRGRLDWTRTGHHSHFHFSPLTRFLILSLTHFLILSLSTSGQFLQSKRWMSHPFNPAVCINIDSFSSREEEIERREN